MDEQTRRPVEAEIIPPGRPMSYRGAESWESPDVGQVHRVYIRQIGPLGGTLLALGIGAAAIVGFFFILGTVIIGLAAIGALTVAGIIAGILSGAEIAAPPCRR